MHAGSMEMLCYTKWDGTLISIIGNTWVYSTVLRQYDCGEKGLVPFIFKRETVNEQHRPLLPYQQNTHFKYRLYSKTVV